MFTHKEGHGNLFKNKVQENSNAPSYVGSIKIDGKIYDLSGWISTTKNKDKYISITSRKQKEQ